MKAESKNLAESADAKRYERGFMVLDFGDASDSGDSSIFGNV
ncbi:MULTISPECIES: hypothetical protein [unclassified Helicobacter]|nr:MULTISPECIES: hypothetical protein [unclassified Helicobacter]